VNSRWGQILAIAGAVAIVVTGTIIVVRSNDTEPGTQTYATATAYAEVGGGGLSRASSVPRTARRLHPQTSTVDSGCRLGQGPGTLAEVPPAVTQRVNRAWEQIEKWLAANAPETAATLAPPAIPVSIASLQRQIGVPLPPELIASLLRHDGTHSTARAASWLPGFYRPLSTAAIAQRAESMCDVLESNGFDGSVGTWWHGQVIPIAADTSTGIVLLDQRPGQLGRLGSHSEGSDMRFGHLPATFAELLEATSNALRTGTVVFEHYRPKVVDRRLEWDIR
jgi:cell wall assembly regulator SMI1